MTSEYWNQYLNKEIILIIDDLPYPKKREGLCVDVDETHIWLQTNIRKEPVPFSRTSVKRIDVKR